jgi:glyoxylase-like metal-dependent hydrolase (beta-lactamase superfamily II)
VLLTHGHVDHSQGAREFAERHRVPVRAWDERLSHSSPPGGVPEVLSANEVVDVDGLAVRVLATPGHTSDSICLLVGHEVMTGDTVLGRGTSLVAHPDGRLADYLESLLRLSRLCADAGVERILPGHGPVLPDPVGVVEYYLQHRVERLEQVQRAVRQGATSAREVVEIVYSDVPREVWPAAETTVMAQLAYLSERGEGG